jgi:kinesin family protein 5
MMGPDIDDPEMKGIIPRMITTVFETIENADECLEFTVKVGYSEIYLEKIRDLLNPSKDDLKIHEDKNRGVYIADLTEEYISDRSEVYELMRVGSSNREVGYTNMNAGSSRSHSLFSITITQNNTQDFSARTGKLYLVDLAGSEKVGKTGAEGKRLDEAKNINKSLSALGKVIYSLTDGKS